MNCQSHSDSEIYHSHMPLALAKSVAEQPTEAIGLGDTARGPAFHGKTDPLRATGQ